MYFLCNALFIRIGCMYKANVMRESQDQIWVINDPLHLWSSGHTNFNISQRLPWLWAWSHRRLGSSRLWQRWHGRSEVASISWWSAPIQPNHVCMHSFSPLWPFSLAWCPSVGSASRLMMQRLSPRRLITPQSSAPPSAAFWSCFPRGSCAALSDWPYSLLWLQDMNRYLNAFWKACHGTL